MKVTIIAAIAICAAAGIVSGSLAGTPPNHIPIPLPFVSAEIAFHPECPRGV